MILDADLELSAAAMSQALRTPKAWLQLLQQAQDFAVLYFTLGTAHNPNPITPPTIQLASGHSAVYPTMPLLPLSIHCPHIILSPDDSSLWLGEGGVVTDATALQQALSSFSPQQLPAWNSSSGPGLCGLPLH